MACTVVSEPAWPEIIDCTRSSASPRRISPTTIRSGRMRSESTNRSRIVTRPVPSGLAGWASRYTVCG